ncbi:hypothetical protein I5V54_07825 [Stenotrophomonas maltophilia]|nr:hypothetical protein [Stenotrophomonas maltophilia]MBH1843653.1 hypothetical protein [Stenotrophomonas maltophilia]
MASLHEQAKRNFESTDKWIYLGANDRESGFAKVGMTMGDLSTRSSSSESPGYYIFCAFKCRDDISEARLKSVEAGALNYLEGAFTHPDGSSARAVHHESGRVSECFYGVDFMDLFQGLHFYLYNNYRDCFSISSFENEFEVEEGEFVDCEFNQLISQGRVNEYIRMIIQ